VDGVIVKHILLTKQNCQKCDWLKSQIPQNDGVDFMDPETPEGMALLAFHEKFDTKTLFPLLITVDGRVVEGALPAKRTLREAGVKLERQTQTQTL